MVERETLNLLVAGSIPARRTIFRESVRMKLYILAALIGYSSGWIFGGVLESDRDPLAMCRYTNKARAFFGVDMRVCG